MPNWQVAFSNRTCTSKSHRDRPHDRPCTATGTPPTSTLTWETISAPAKPQDPKTPDTMSRLGSPHPCREKHVQSSRPEVAAVSCCLQLNHWREARPASHQTEHLAKGATYTEWNQTKPSASWLWHGTRRPMTVTFQALHCRGLAHPTYRHCRWGRRPAAAAEAATVHQLVTLLCRVWAAGSSPADQLAAHPASIRPLIPAA